MPVLACSLLAVTLSAAVVDAAAGADGEVAAGRAPIDLGGDEVNSFTFTLVPGAGLRLRSDTTTLRLTYAPRIFYRLPNALDVSRPLVLHQISLDHTAELTRALTWTNTAQLSFGELDYTGTGLIFPVGTSSALRGAVANVVRVEGQTGIRLLLDRRLTLAWDAAAEYTTSPDDPVTVTIPDPTSTPEMQLPDLTITANPVPDSAQVSTEASLSYALSRDDRVAALGEVTYQWFPDTGRYLVLSPGVSWERRLSRRTNMSLAGGIAYVITLATVDGDEPSDAIGGTGRFQLGSTLYSSSETTVTSSFSASLDWFFDPLAGTSQPRAGAEASTNITMGDDWVIAPNAGFYTVLREASATLGGEDGMTRLVQITPDATMLRAEIPFYYSITRGVGLSFGGRATLRGPALTEDRFRLHEQYELWAFVGLTVRLTTSRDDGSWLPL